MFDRFRKADEFAEQHEQELTSAASRREASLAHQALAVSINPADGKVWNGGRLVAPTALLLELVALRRLSASGTGKEARVEIVDPSPVGDEDLDEALLTIGAGLESNKVVSLLGAVPQTSTVLQRMVAGGLLTNDEHKRLGLSTAHRHHPTPLARREELAGRLRAALTGDAVPDERTAMVVGALVRRSSRQQEKRSRTPATASSDRPPPPGRTTSSSGGPGGPSRSTSSAALVSTT